LALRCEVCGRKIHGKPVKAIIEGAKLMVCSQCSRHGQIVFEEVETSQQALGTPMGSVPKPGKSKAQGAGGVEASKELVEDFDVKIREARMQMGLSHEELGKKISEKVSVLKKIETKKIIPNDRLAAKLEHALRIKLLVPAGTEEKASSLQAQRPQSRELTLGDLMRLKRVKSEEKT
jgi:putative transcription factor